MKKLLASLFLSALTLLGVDSSITRMRGGAAINVFSPGLVGLSITSPVTGQQGWTFGQSFKQGDVASGKYITASSGIVTFQAEDRNFWPDGSVKYAVLSGVTSFTANTPVSIALGTTSSAPSGTNVAEPSSLPGTSVVFTTTGTTYSIASGGTYSPTLNCHTTGPSWTSGGGVAGCVRQTLGPTMSEFHYYAPTSDPQVTVWWYVRVYAANSCGTGCQSIEVQTEIENGWWNKASPSQKDYGVTVNVNGVQTYQNSLIGEDLGWTIGSTNTSTSFTYVGQNVLPEFPVGEQFYVNGNSATLFTVTSSTAPGNGTTTVNVSGGLPATITDVYVVGHFSHSRWGRVDWVGGNSNPLFPALNTSYLASTKVIPNFGWRAPAASTLTGFHANSLNPPPFVSNQTPGGAVYYGDLSFALGTAGNDNWIGVVPDWDALYATTADNSVSYTLAQREAIYNTFIGNTRAADFFDQHFRDETTGRVPAAMSYPTEAVYSGWQTGPPGTTSGNWSTPGGRPPYWQSNEGQSHQAGEGYLAYLVEGRWTDLEDVQWNGWIVVQDEKLLTGTTFGTIVPLSSPSTTRGWAWGERSIGAAASITPTSLGVVSPSAPLAADIAVGTSLKTSISRSMAYAKAVYIDGTTQQLTTAFVGNGIGWMGAADQYSGAPIPATEYWSASWMYAFIGQSFGFINDLSIEGLTSQDYANLMTVRNFSWLDTLQMMQGSTTENAAIQTWNFRRGGVYAKPYLGSNTVPTSAPPVFLSGRTMAGLPYADYTTTFGLSVLTANPGDTLRQRGEGGDLDVPANTPSSSGWGGEGYWALHGSVVALAAENGIDKANLRWNLLTSASNFNPQLQGASDEPQLSFAPRAFGAPGWYTAAAHNTWIALDGTSCGVGCTKPNSILQGSSAQVNASLASWNTQEKNSVTPWGGGYINSVGITAYPNNNFAGTAVWMPGEFYCVGGGGHTDYQGNERYCFGPLASNTAAWYAPRKATNPPVLLEGSFTATASGSTVTTVTIGDAAIAIGQSIYGAGIPNGTTITGGSSPNWTVSASGLNISTAEQMYTALNASPSTPWQNSNGDFVSNHSYNSNVYLPNQNWELDSGRYATAPLGGIGSPITAILPFNIANPNSNPGPWVAGASYPGNVASSSNLSVNAAYDPVTNKVWSISRAAWVLNYYDLTTNTYTSASHGNFVYNQSNSVVAIDTKRGIMAWWNGEQGMAGPTFQLLFFQLSTGINGSPYSPCIQTLPAEPPVVGLGFSYGSILYDSADDQWMVWYNSGATVYKIKAPTDPNSPYVAAGASCTTNVQWTVTTVTPSSGATPDMEAGSGNGDCSAAPCNDTGTYGRWAYDPNSNMPSYMLLNRVTSPIYVFKP